MLTKLPSGIKRASQALLHCGLNWGIQSSPVYDIEGKEIPTHVSLSRTDTGAQLSIVKKTYKWIENSFLGLFDELCGKNKCEYVAGGLLHGGRQTFLVVRTEKAEILHGDEICNDIVLFNSFDLSSSCRAISVPFRMICSNQLSRVMRENTMNISIRHTSGIQERAAEAFRLFDTSMTSFTLFVNQARMLAKKSVNDQQVKYFLDQLIPFNGTRSKNMRERVMELFHAGKGCKGQSAFDLVNGYVELLDHNNPQNQKSENDTDGLISSRLIGHRAYQKSKAFDLALAM
jgi:phage/plasmid-like protein (TIGR03299 family)